MYRIILFVLSVFLFSLNPLFAQKSSKKDDSQVLSDSRASSGTSIFEAREGRSSKKNTRVQRSKNTKTYQKQAYKRNKSKSSRKKGNSDCDCPGSKKAQRKKRRA
jgi:hypothetical protein